MSEPDPAALARAQLVHELHDITVDLERFAGIASGKTRALPIDVMDTPLDQICQAFELDAFERAILVMTAGIEIDSAFAQLCARVNGDPALAFPTFGLAIATLSGGYWAAASPAMALRRWNLVELGEAHALARTPLRIDEAVLHFILDGFFWDEALAGVARPFGDTPRPVPSHAEFGQTLAAILNEGDAVGQLIGAGLEERRTVIASAAHAAGLSPFAMAVQSAPATTKERERLARRWERTARLLDALLVLEDDEADAGDEADREQWRAARLFLESVDAPAVLSGRQRRRLAGRPVVTIEISTPTAHEQRGLWAEALGLSPDDALARDLSGAFNLGAGPIQAIALAAENGGQDAATAPDGESSEPAETASTEAPEAIAEPVASQPDPAKTRDSAVWVAARAQLRPRLDALAQRVDASAGWESLVVARKTLTQLHEIADQALLRGVVRDEWGFGRAARGQSVTALFAGGSGTGKTLAAEVLAHAVGLDLYRIDLSAVVDKYIGETEKNLARLFDAADNGAAILFFDEADVLFGKRTEVKDGRDRYANVEVGYLLQRLETYRGVAILSTNMREGLDAAFVRRIRFMVDFGFPDAAARARLWRIAFPTTAPLADEVDFEALADMQFSGGQIASIAVNAAYRAAADSGVIGMPHILSACRHELAKASQPPDHPLLAGVRS